MFLSSRYFTRCPEINKKLQTLDIKSRTLIRHYVGNMQANKIFERFRIF